MFSDDEGETSMPAAQTVNLRHCSYNINASGSVDSQVSYISTPASPGRSSASHAPEEFPADSYAWLDPGHSSHTEEMTGPKPDCKRDDMVSVSALFFNIDIIK